MKDTIAVGFGTVLSLIASLFGGWDHAMISLVIVMCVDYITGIIVAGVFHISHQKLKTARLSRVLGGKACAEKGSRCWSCLLLVGLTF